MPHVSINPDGSLVYRTKLMPSLPQAQGFAKCLQANASRFTGVVIVPSATAKTPKWFVEFKPVSTERQGAMLLSQWNAREERAKSEGGEYVFWPDPDHTGDFWCFNPISGETYQVSCFRCTCPDYECRCKRAGLQCKHQLAWEMQSQAGTLGKTDKQTPQEKTREERAAWVAANRDLDF